MGLTHIPARRRDREQECIPDCDHLALLLARGATVVLRRPAPQLAALALTALASAASLHGLMVYGERNPGHHDLTPQRLGALSKALDREGVRTVVADYWIAYALSFETRERIIATPMYTVRYRPYQERVGTAGARTYVFFQGQPQATELLEAAQDFGVGHRQLTVGSFVVLLFDEPVGDPPPPSTRAFR